MNFKIKPIHILAIVIIVALLGVVYVVVSGAFTPTVAAGDTIEVYYTGSFTNGTVFNSNVGQQPLQFTVGSGQLIQGFDQGVIGMKLNQNKILTIPANEAYGPINPDLIVNVSTSNFGNATIQTGMIVNRSEGGQNFQGVVTFVGSNTVTVNFNPPLAGKTLIFNITVVSITKGT